MNQKRFLCWMLGFLCLAFKTTNSFAQELIPLKGRVIEKTTGRPLPGASITEIKKNGKSTTSDADGNFQITTTLNTTIKITMIGYKQMEVIAKSSQLTIELDEQIKELDETIVVGYGTQKKASLTSAVSSIKAAEITNIPTSNLSNVLAGRLSGTAVVSNTGTPGISSGIRIRGFSSPNGTPVVYVIDGVLRDKTSFDALDPNEVSEITVLKDAAAAAIYGSRSSGGVVLVTTKMGKTGKTEINFSVITSTEQEAKLPDYMDVSKGLDYSIAVNGGISPEEKDWVLKNNPKGDNYFKAAYQDPSNQRYALSASGGSEMITYYIGGSFFNEKGFLPNVWYKKYNLRGNINAKLTKDLNINLNLGNSYGTRNRFNFTYDGGSDDLGNLWGKLLYWDAWKPAYINGMPVDPGWLGNPVEMMKNGGYWRNNNQQLDALLSAEYKLPFVPGLSAKISYSKNFNNSFTKTFAKKQILYKFKTAGENNLITTDQVESKTMSGDPGTEYLGNEYNKSNTYQLNGQLSYNRQFGMHNINATAVYEQWEGNYNNFSMYRYNFPLAPIDQFFAASGNNADWSTGGSENQGGRESYIGRINYDYAGKYLLSVSARYDGSTNFAPNQRWGLFPSISGGWIVSDENFFKEATSLKFIDFLKLRFSYGTTGNDAVGGWNWLEQYNIQSSTYFLGQNGTTAPRLKYGGTPTQNLTWEKSTTYNAGLDIRSLNHISLTAELWKRHTYDILKGRVLVLPVEYGAGLPSENYAVVDSKGFEIELGYDNSVGQNFKYSAKANFGFATNKVLKQDVATNAQAIDNPIGKTLNYGSGYEATGIIRTTDELAKLPATYRIFGAQPELGMMNFADKSGPSGVPDGLIDGYDRIKLGDYFGSGNAPITYGLTIDMAYKGFSVNMLFAGLSGFKTAYNDAWGRNFGGGAKVPSYHDDAWSTDNPNGTTPKLYPWGDARANGYTQTSTFNVYNGSFMRLKNLNIGYDIPEKLLNKLNIKGIRIFGSGTNLFTLSKFKFYDPEISGFMSYPIMKTYTMGIDIRL